MTSKQTTASAPQRQVTAPPSAAAVELGPMPVWDLSDLYPGPDSPKVRGDLEKAAADAQRFEGSYKGKLVALAADGAALARAIAAYETLSDTIGKLGSYAGL